MIVQAEAHAQREDVARAVVALKSIVSRALMGAVDPSESAAAAELISVIETHFAPADDKLTAFCAAMRSPGSIPGLSRPVVLARAQRYLLALSMKLEDEAPQQETPKKGRSRNTNPVPMTPFDPALLEFKGVGPKTAARLASRGLSTPMDVLFWLPRRYDDRRTVTPMAQLQPGMRVVTCGTVERTRVYGRPWMRIMEVTVTDGDAAVSAMWFSNRRPRGDRFVKGARVTLAGLVARYKDRLQIAHPIVVVDGEDSDKIGRVVPVYAEVPDVPGATVEKAIGSALPRVGEFVRDPLPAALLRSRELMTLAEALTLVHRPPLDVEPALLDAWIDGNSPAHLRLAYDEFFYIQLALLLRRRAMGTPPAPRLASPDPQFDAVTRSADLMGFSPTGAQARAIGEIVANMAQPRPMRRLLQGDVGSGKTMVALGAILATVNAGGQVALMAPTEILAEQHMRTLSPVLARAGIKCVLHIGAARASTRKKSLQLLENGVARVAIGTHALIQESVHFAALGLAVVDEQHRFGVSQRLGLVGKGPQGTSPHLLVMTATPIPRTLALTVHGDLDVSVLDELPPGRTPIATTFWPRDQRREAIGKLVNAVDRGEQCFVVCPLIDESEKMDLSAATDVYAEMVALFGEDRTALLHGRLPPEERDAAMDGFLSGRTKVLVATTVIEVGVDVPGATVMMVDGAERFGLAQLHQLRGRVGRGALASECHLVGDLSTEDSRARMEVLVRTTDGFEIAEADLAIRGPGELYGRKQAGLPGFRFGDLARDVALVETARGDARALLEEDPDASLASTQAIWNELARRIGAGDGPVGEESG